MIYKKYSTNIFYSIIYDLLFIINFLSDIYSKKEPINQMQKEVLENFSNNIKEKKRKFKKDEKMTVDDDTKINLRKKKVRSTL